MDGEELMSLTAIAKSLKMSRDRTRSWNGKVWSCCVVVMLSSTLMVS